MILLYHLVFPDSTPKDAWNAGLILRLAAFKLQLSWLKRHGEILPLETYVDAYLEDPDKLKRKYALTFDDGYRQVFDLVTPFLEEEKIPATFFATTSHLEDGRLLWFVYFNALCSERCYQQVEIEGKPFALTDERSSMAAWRKLIAKARASGDAIGYSREVSQKYPLPQAVIDKYIGVSKEQLRQIGESSLLDVGGHTHDHPYLDQISASDQRAQVIKNRLILEERSGHPVKFFAYTGGVYNLDSVDVIKDLGFSAAFAIEPRGISKDNRFELPRVDIYSPSLLKFKVKALGFQKLVRTLLLRDK